MGRIRYGDDPRRDINTLGLETPRKERIIKDYLNGEIEPGDPLDGFTVFGGVGYTKKEEFKVFTTPGALAHALEQGRVSMEELVVLIKGKVQRKEFPLPEGHEHLENVEHYLKQLERKPFNPFDRIGRFTREGYKPSNQELLERVRKQIKEESHPYGGGIDVL